MNRVSRYTFGDTDLAARRLELVAAAFEGSSRAFLDASLPAGTDVVVDLGCGPGFTTQLVADVARPALTVGVDISEAFVALARQRTAQLDIAFTVHDVTALPLPHAPADAIYARLLLSHLPEPETLVEQWRSQLGDGGRLLLDEVESIEAPPGVLRDYEDVACAVVAHGGGPMYAGPLLAALGGECTEVPVDAAHAAGMYGMNLTVWRSGAEEAGLATAGELDRIAVGLAKLATQPGAATVCWVMRQVVVPADFSSFDRV